MKIIDAHIHMLFREHFEALCKASGHTSKLDDLMREFERLGIVGAIVMGSSNRNDAASLIQPGLFDLNGAVDLAHYNYPRQVSFCLGVNPQATVVHPAKEVIANFRKAAAHPNCVGLKIYPGYNYQYPNDPIYHPYFEMAEDLKLPVAIHTGDTATHTGKLRYSHPLAVDDVAVEFPRVNFVMCHLGNPWFNDAAEVVKKNPNVFADLSGLAVGMPDVAGFVNGYASYLDTLRTWLCYLDDYSKLMYGSDWPLVNLERYISICGEIIPPAHHEAFFGGNALRIYPKLKAAIGLE